MTQKQTLSQDEHSGLWFYDLVMADIEPDLCSSNIDRLEELYPEESKISEDARLERYENAFELFENLIKNMKDVRIEDAQEEKKKMQQKLQKQESSERSEDVSDAASKLDSFDQQ